MKITCRFFIALTLILFNSVFAQSDVDSLKLLLPNTLGEEKAEVLIELSKAYKGVNKDSAFLYGYQAVEEAEEFKLVEMSSAAYFQMGKLYTKYKDRDSIIHYYLLSAEIEDQLGNKKKAAYRMAVIGDAYFRLSNLKKAIYYMELAVGLCREIEDNEKEALYLVYLGTFNFQLGEYDNAIQSLTQSLRINEKLEKDQQIGENLNSIGAVYHEIGNYAKALEYFNAALKVRERINDLYGMAGSYNNIGLVHAENKEYDKSIENYRLSLEICKNDGFDTYRAANYNNIASVYKNRGDYDRALEYLLLAIEMNEAMNDKRSIVPKARNIASIYQRQGMYTLALEYYIKALAIAEEIGMKNDLKEIYLGLAIVYENQGEYQEALSYHQKYVATKDSIMNEEKVMAVEEMVIKYESEKKELENAQLKTEAKAKQQTQLILIVFGATILAIAVLLFILFRIKSRLLSKSKQINEKENMIKELEAVSSEKEKQRLEELVFAEHKINQLQKEKISILNQQMSLTAMQMLSKTELLFEIKKVLETDILPASQNPESLKKIIQLIESNESFDRDWDTFKKHFEEVNQGFFETLQKLDAGISQNDLKLCAYIKVGLSTKEIARILNVTVAAVNKSRQRLKKKLGLEQSQDLSAFILEL